jgi:hypothetical protein
MDSGPTEMYPRFLALVVKLFKLVRKFIEGLVCFNELLSCDLPLIHDLNGEHELAIVSPESERQDIVE